MDPRSTIVDRQRRSLLFGGSQRSPVRPPWTAEAGLIADCTGCGKCASACPERIISLGAGRLPELDFGSGECTFCGACAEACEEPVFADRRDPRRAFPHVVRIDGTCLTGRGVLCRSCGDACPESAISFSLRLGPGAPVLDGEACIGCGACIGACPAGSIGISMRDGCSDG